MIAGLASPITGGQAHVDVHVEARPGQSATSQGGGPEAEQAPDGTVTTPHTELKHWLNGRAGDRWPRLRAGSAARGSLDSHGQVWCSTAGHAASRRRAWLTAAGPMQRGLFRGGACLGWWTTSDPLGL